MAKGSGSIQPGAWMVTDSLAAAPVTGRSTTATTRTGAAGHSADRMAYSRRAVTVSSNAAGSSTRVRQ